VVPGICWTLVPAQPFAEQQMCASEVGGRDGAAENVDRLQVKLAGLIRRCHQRSGPGEQAAGPAGSAGGGAALQVGECGGGFGRTA
jgi:hypothetical protein